MNQQSRNYNLLDERWIPVLWTDGTPRRVAVRAALTEAGSIRQVAAPNPMDNAALLRLLLAVLQWSKPSMTDAERTELESANGIPQAWLARLDGDRAKFDLLGDAPRFYQDGTAVEQQPNRPISDLFAYLPAATEINHFRHVFDRTIALCPACCAVGLARLPACATQGGQGKSPSINNAPPVYFLPMGPTLLETLRANWPMQGEVGDDRPAWEEADPPDNIGVLEGLTWQPRVAWLGPLVEAAGGRCARCGAAGPHVSELVCKKGRSRKGDARPWGDPHVAWSGETDTALRGPDPLKYPSSEAALWLRTTRAALESAGENPRVPVIGEWKARLQHPSDLRVVCSQPFTRQAKTFDEHRDALSIPSGLLANEALRGRALEEIAFVEGLDPWKCLRTLSASGSVSDAARSAWATVAGDTNERLRRCFADLLIELAQAQTDEGAEGCVRCWRDEVLGALRHAFERVAAVTTTGSPLKRRESVLRVRAALDKELRSAAT